jgi:diaminopimelate decarboxylase
MDSVRFVAEPGRYFVSAATTIVTQVYSRKGGRNAYQALYVNDGVYGSFNNVVYDHATPVPKKLSIVLAQEAAAVAARKAAALSAAASSLSAAAALAAPAAVRAQEQEEAHLVTCISMEDVSAALHVAAGEGAAAAAVDAAAEEEVQEQAGAEEYMGIPTAIFGPTCDGLDQMCSLESTLLPRCEVGDWLVWENQGAYTHTASFVFNGFTHIPKRTYVIQ